MATGRHQRGAGSGVDQRGRCRPASLDDRGTVDLVEVDGLASAVRRCRVGGVERLLGFDEVRADDVGAGSGRFDQPLRP